MSVELDPPELGFRRPFTHEVTHILTIRNPSSDPVAFKVKTTAPKQYCVRPNSGRIDPGKDVEIQVLLQAMKEDPPLDARCRDKFLVQSVAISADQDIYNIAAIWQNIEQTAKSSIQERKIRVSFLPSTEHSTPHANNVNGTHISDEPLPAYSASSPNHGSPGPDAVTPQRHAQDAPSSAHFTDSKDTTQQGSVSSLFTNPSAALGAASTGLSNAASSTSETLQQQLEAAKATIAQLRGQVQDEGIRERKTAATKQDAQERISSGAAALGLQTQPADGVPVQIVAALCLLSFLLAYFFF